MSLGRLKKATVPVDWLSWTWTSSHPSSPHWLRISCSACEMSGTLAYSHFVKVVAPSYLVARRLRTNNLLDVTERLIHSASGRVLAEDTEWARSMRARVRGLIGRHAYPPALVLEPASQVHTAFMRAAIDVVFCDDAWVVLHVARMRPWRISRWVRGARRAVELPAGAARGVAVGDLLKVEPYAKDR